MYIAASLKIHNCATLDNDLEDDLILYSGLYGQKFCMDYLKESSQCWMGFYRWMEQCFPSLCLYLQTDSDQDRLEIREH